MTDQRREQRTYPPRSAYMHYIHTIEMAKRHERQRQIAELDEEIRRDEAVMLKRQRDSRMQTEQAIRELQLEQERRLIKEKQRHQEREERRIIRNQNRAHLERELKRIKNELRAELAKEEIKCQNSDDEDKCQEKKESANMPEREECLEQIEDCEQLAAVELETRAHKQRNNERKSPAADQVQEIIQDETKEEDHNKDVEHENDCVMEQNERSGEEEGTEVQRDYSNDNSNADSMSSDDTVQQDCRCNSVILYGQLETSRAQTTTLEVLQNTNHQEMPVDHTLDVCIDQECTSDDIVQSDCAPANLSDEQLQVSGTKITSLKVHHETDLQKKAMQRTLWMYIAQECVSDTQVPLSLIQLKILLGGSQIRDIVCAELIYIGRTCKNSYLCFKFLWWQEGTLSS